MELGIKINLTLIFGIDIKKKKKENHYKIIYCKYFIF